MEPQEVEEKGTLGGTSHLQQSQAGQCSIPYVGSWQSGRGLRSPSLLTLARLPEGAQERRMDLSRLLPPSLGMEIGAIQQVSLGVTNTETPYSFAI